MPAVSARFLGTISNALVGSLLMIGSANPALACACCTDPGWRHVEVEKLTPWHLDDIIDKIRFAKSARLMFSENDNDEEDGIKGLADLETDYTLQMARLKGRFQFSFRDTKSHTGTLILTLPKNISIFEVDPRDAEKDEGLGPTLFKEWKLTAPAAGDGIFRGALGRGQQLTLVLHGQGNACTNARDFTAWTLMVHGPIDRFILYGALER